MFFRFGNVLRHESQVTIVISEMQSKLFLILRRISDEEVQFKRVGT